MDCRQAVSIVLEAHLPYVKENNGENGLSSHVQGGSDSKSGGHKNEEERLFEYISGTLLPLLGVLDRLENDHIPFCLALVMSPVICHMLSDNYLIAKYMDYTDRQLEFGKNEIERTAGSEFGELAEIQYNKILDKRILFTERYGKNILKTINFYKGREKIEIIASNATHAFMPFLSHNAESMQAQIEIPVSSYRRIFGSCPQGFWLPELGWTPAVEQYLRSYNYSYTIIDSHGLLFGKPIPQKGSFFPVKTPNGTFILSRDFYAVQEIEKIICDEIYLDNNRDAGYELPHKFIKGFLSPEGERRRTGYKYWAKNGQVYNIQKTKNKVVEHTRLFMENTIARLTEASKYMKETPLCLYAGNADNFGRFWHEGPQFLETLFRMAAGYRDFKFICPSEYIFKQNLADFQVVSPEFSSWGDNGYAQTWLDASSDWIYRHLARAMERMTELAERFLDDTGLKERALNQAAREILLAQSSDWPALLYKQDSTEYARYQAENALRNFTTIYEALGSNYISTEWLTTLERRHNIFPNINYRIFRRKR